MINKDEIISKFLPPIHVHVFLDCSQMLKHGKLSLVIVTSIVTIDLLPVSLNLVRSCWSSHGGNGSYAWRIC